MKIITQRTLAASAAQRWQQQYQEATGSKAEKGRLLKALGDDPDPSDVNRVIGNTSWTDVPSCDECGDEADFIIRVGEEPDSESSVADLCLKCLRAAVALVEAHLVAESA